MDNGFITPKAPSGSVVQVNLQTRAGWRGGKDTDVSKMGSSKCNAAHSALRQCCSRRFSTASIVFCVDFSTSRDSERPKWLDPNTSEAHQTADWVGHLHLVIVSLPQIIVSALFGLTLESTDGFKAGIGYWRE